MSKEYIYVIEAYAYSDFETHILCHTQEYSNSEFGRIVYLAQKLCEKNKYYTGNFTDYSRNMIECLKKEYGFREFDYPNVHIGSNTSSELTSFFNGELITIKKRK